MAIERFTWATEKGAEGDIVQRVRSKQFGDGYEQSVEDGLNNRSQSWSVTFTGLKGRIKDIMAFLDRHAGARAFVWTTPLGQLGLFTCKNPVPTPVGGGVFKLTATFDRAFQP